MTPTQITLTTQAGPMQVNMSFFNPVEVRSNFFNSLNFYSLILFSQGIGSGNPHPSHTSPLWHSRWMVQLIKWKCILTLAHVCEIILRTIAYLMKNCRFGDNGGYQHRTFAVECHIKRRDYLPHFNVLSTSLVERGFLSGGMGYVLLCYEGCKRLLLFYLVAHGPCI